MLMESNVLSDFMLNIYCTELLFFKIKIIRYGVYVLMKETGEEGFVQV